MKWSWAIAMKGATWLSLDDTTPTSNFGLQISNSQLRTPNYTDCQLSIFDFRFPTCDCQLPTSDFQLPAAKLQSPNPDFPFPTFDFRLSTPDFQCLTFDIWLPTSDFQLLTWRSEQRPDRYSLITVPSKLRLIRDLFKGELLKHHHTVEPHARAPQADRGLFGCPICPSTNF